MEPAAVATGFIIPNIARRAMLYSHLNPVATAPGSVFVSREFGNAPRLVLQGCESFLHAFLHPWFKSKHSHPGLTLVNALSAN